MSVNLRERIIAALRPVLSLHRGVHSTVQVNEEAVVTVVLEVDPAQGVKLEQLRQEIEALTAAVEGVKKAMVVMTAQKDPHGMSKNPVLDIPAHRIILVASGKGGVGKSTIAANIAVALGRTYKVGLLDADIYGPSIPTMMGAENFKPALNEQRKFEPLQKYGIKIMSIGFLMEASKALVWRGPMVQTAVYQMLRDVAWAGPGGDKLDYLMIDLPPGTGDVQLTLAQKIKASGAIVVSTPQDIALIDARRAIEMFRTTGVPVIGIVENMSQHVCSQCGHTEPIFGHGGAEAEAKKLGVAFLGAIPLARNIREQSDAGTPIVLTDSKGIYTQSFENVAEAIVGLG